MKVHKLNCTACGAPISIPEEVEQLNCSACGTFLMIQRGEGYIALKMVEEVSRVIKHSGKETQSAIREGANVTRAELRRMQLGQEISNLETQIESLRTEIRSLRRQPDNQAAQKEVLSLHWQELEKLNRLRKLHSERSKVGNADPDKDLNSLIQQLTLVRQESQVLEEARSVVSNYQDLKKHLASTGNDLEKKIFSEKVRRIKKELKSPGLLKIPPVDRNELTQHLNILFTDIQKLKSTPPSQERNWVINELERQYDTLYETWKNAESSRLQTALVSVGVNPLSSRQTNEVENALRLIQADLQTLQAWEQNAVQKEQLTKLQILERQTSKHLGRLRMRDQYNLGNIWLPAVGIAAIWVSFWRSTRERFKSDPSLTEPQNKDTKGKVGEGSNNPATISSPGIEQPNLVNDALPALENQEASTTISNVEEIETDPPILEVEVPESADGLGDQDQASDKTSPQESDELEFSTPEFDQPTIKYSQVLESRAIPESKGSVSSVTKVPYEAGTTVASQIYSKVGNRKVLAWFRGCLLAIVTLIGLICISVIIVPTSASSDPGSNSTWPAGLFVLVITAGFVAGTYLFFSQVKPAVRIWISRPRNSEVKVGESGNAESYLSPTLTGLLGGLSLWLTIWSGILGVVLLFNSDSAIPLLLFLIGLILGPAAAVWQFLTVRRTTRTVTDLPASK